MSVEVLRFAGPAREVVGVLQRPEGTVEGRPAFLLCKPFGQEAVRTNQMFQALAQRLCREGCTVLRFDYHGTGDAPGDGADQTLAGWTADTLAAWEQLEAYAGAAPVHLFGVGLGATLAALAAVQRPHAAARVVLWEPVLEGPAYLQALLEAHRREVARELQTPWRRLRRENRVPEPTLPGSVIGFDMGPTLTREIEALRPEVLRRVAVRQQPLLIALRDDQRRGLAVGALPDAELLSIEETIDWMSGDARGTAIVPRQIQTVLLAGLTGAAEAEAAAITATVAAAVAAAVTAAETP
ncbi:alpha/beta fold hydrolase [Caldimonas brevitalea]|uniref:Serine aminopeptidase S33 domain-containing protein n=1 Tax=Caldimonas brevitalea TaxID=413882 RepID=A0A0G3BK87_9BURK|nr:alpha/beta fold hydrolase [Caldimonas brevitalea]AKJ29874.1 hypothetical protein AAW51_3183 [Caldimonas brevitalea]